MVFNFGTPAPSAGNNNGAPAAPAPGAPAPSTFSFGSTPAAPGGGAAPAPGGTPAFGAAAPATTGGAAAPSFSFGSTPATTPAAGSTPATTAAPPAPSFGAAPPAAGASTAPAPTPATTAPTFGAAPGTAPATTPAAPTTAPTFGSTPAAPGAATPAPATGGGGFSFGGAAPSAAAPAPTNALATTTTTTTATTTTAPPPAAGGGFSFGGAPAPTTNNAPGTTTTTTTPAAPPPAVHAPAFETTFPGLATLATVRRGDWNGDDFISSMETLLLQVATVWQQHKADPAVRQKMVQQRTVTLEVPPSPHPVGSSLLKFYKTQEAQLTDDILREVFQVADQLALTEEQTLSLLSEAKRLNMAPEQLYWDERKAHLETLLLLFQKRWTEQDVEHPLVKMISQLLEKGLIAKLLKLIRDVSTRLDLLVDQRRRQMAEAAALNTNNSMDTSSDGGDAKTRNALKGLTMHIEFGCQQRQSAAELLFFIAYNFHWDTKDELIPLIQLIRDVSSGNEQNLEVSPGLLPANPLDVPSPYQVGGTDDFLQQQQHQLMAYAGFPSQSSRHAQEEKNPFCWQKELVDHVWNQGGPQRLRCVATLLMTATQILDVPQSLLNRSTNQEETHSDDHVNELLAELHQALFVDSWNVPHIQGVLHGCFALLLKSTNNPVTTSPLSPRHSSPFGGGGSPDSGASAMYRKDFRTALEGPSEVKSLSFVRFSMLPALQIPVPTTTEPSPLSVSEFLLQVLTDWTSKYFGLLLQHNPPISRQNWLNDAQENLNLRRQDLNRRLEFQRSQGIRERHEAVPSSVDLLMRPDCLDDLLALCCNVCELGPAYANMFWSKQDVAAVIPQVEVIQHQDSSLLSCYIDLLASLALDAPESVHEFLCGKGPLRGDGRRSATWQSIMSIIRYYVRSLLNKGNNSTTPADTEPRNQSTMYYTEYDGSSGGSMMDARPKSASSSSRASELGEDNTLILSSHLRLIHVVASQSPEARAYLRKLTLPIDSGAVVSSNPGSGGGGVETSSFGSDSLWRILFTLASTPISPELRGLTFDSLASTMQGGSLEEIRLAWNLVEDSQILPIHKILLGFKTPIQDGAAPRIAFPPSSTSRVKEKHCKSWIEANTVYSLLYEMEYIEASIGFYPSTCGFLRLLRELIQAGGCPADLGSNWRPRPGCVPYIEYVTDLVLPRATGLFGNLPSLPFRSSSDKNQLIAAGLDVVSACLRRYIVPEFSREQEPTLSQSLSQAKKKAAELLALSSLVDSTVANVEEGEFFTFLYDFMDNVHGQTGPNGAAMQQNQLIGNPGVTKAKSPGFHILAEILNLTGGSLQRVVQALLREGIASQDDVDRYLLSMALYGAMPPTMTSAKAGDSYSLKNLLLPLKSMDGTSVDIAASSWKSRTARLLEILCSVAAREKSFAMALDAFKGAAEIIPVVKFQQRSSAPTSKMIQASQIPHLFCGRKEMEAVVAFVGHLAYDELAVTRGAMGLLFYLENVSKSSLLPEDYFVPAVAPKLRLLGLGCNGKNVETELMNAVLSRGLRTLHSEQPSSYFLGLPGHSDGVDALVHILGMFDPNRGDPRLVAMGYEILVEAMNVPAIAASLSRGGFWKAHLLQLLSTIETVQKTPSMDETDLWLSVRWVLAGLAQQLVYLAATSYTTMPTAANGHNGPAAYEEVVKFLLEEEILLEILRGMPSNGHHGMSVLDVSALVSDSIHLLVGALAISSSKFHSEIATSSIVKALLERLSQTSDASSQKSLAWAAFAALDYNLVTEEDSPMTHVKDLASLIPNGGIAAVVASVTLAEIYLFYASRDDINAVTPDIMKNAAPFLLQTSCDVRGDHSLVQPTTEALLVRNCLKILLSSMDEDEIRIVLQSEAVVSWVKLVERQDGDIVSLLQLICNFEFGPGMLLKYDILRAIENVAIQVMRHIEDVAAGSLQTVERAVPKYWRGHLDLMSILLVHAPRNRQTEAANHVIEILRHYEPISDLLLSSFPMDGDTAVSYVRCCSVAVALATSNPFLSTQTKSIAIPSHAHLSKLALTLSEYPLPMEFLRRPIPDCLKRSVRLKSSFASIAPEVIDPWWNKLDIKDWQSAQSDLFYYGILGGEIAKAGLFLLREADILGRLDCAQLGRALCRNVDALNVIGPVRVGDPFAEEQMKLADHIRSNVVELLIVATDHLKVRRAAYERSYGEPDWEEITRPLKAALDYTRLDSGGFTSTGRNNNHEENRGDPIVNLATALRSNVTGRREMITQGW